MTFIYLAETQMRKCGLLGQNGDKFYYNNALNFSGNIFTSQGSLTFLI